MVPTSSQVGPRTSGQQRMQTKEHMHTPTIHAGFTERRSASKRGQGAWFRSVACQAEIPAGDLTLLRIFNRRKRANGLPRMGKKRAKPLFYIHLTDNPQNRITASSVPTRPPARTVASTGKWRRFKARRDVLPRTFSAQKAPVHSRRHLAIANAWPWLPARPAPLHAARI